jgi:membrane complex biogenesis BtpA family protein
MALLDTTPAPDTTRGPNPDSGSVTVVGMVHLDPLPGSPGFDHTTDGGRDRLRERAVDDARALADGGVDAVLVENFGDVPFYPDEVPTHVVASMTDAVGRVADAVDRPVGVNVLRNDAEAALSVAAATDASFVRVNVHAGARVTDQGVVEGRAHRTLRLRSRLGADVDILADVGVKHSTPLGAERPLDESVDDVVTRGLADAVVVSGRGTGHAVDEERLARAATACARHGAPLFVGSGVTAETVADCLAHADGVVVGTALKEDGETTNPVDESRVRALVGAARGR